MSRPSKPDADAAVLVATLRDELATARRAVGDADARALDCALDRGEEVVARLVERLNPARDHEQASRQAIVYEYMRAEMGRVRRTHDEVAILRLEAMAAGLSAANDRVPENRVQ